tara:strand:- start:652 stop:801 length:150 start_codon:yes stop_codon:yes gene_type:complete
MQTIQDGLDARRDATVGLFARRFASLLVTKGLPAWSWPTLHAEDSSLLI